MNHLKLMWAFLILLLVSAPSMASNEIEIDTDVSGSVTPTVSAATLGSAITDTAVVSIVSPVVLTATPTVVMPTPTVGVKGMATVISEEVSDQTVEAPAPTALVVQGVLKMTDVYRAGLSYYKKQDFAKAIRYLKESLQVHDPYTPKYYYAEAYAMLGVIYQFHIIDRDTAYAYYKEALAIDPDTATARKHIQELSRNDVSK